MLHTHIEIFHSIDPTFDGLPDDNTLREWREKAGILDTIDKIEEEENDGDDDADDDNDNDKD